MAIHSQRPGSPTPYDSQNAHASTSASSSDGGGSGSSRPYPYKLDPLPDGLQTYDQVVRDLKRLLNAHNKGYFEVHAREDDGYDAAVSIFNGAIISAATAVVKPTNAGQVSKLIKYCREHDLHMSVKGGGTGVHGQSIAGHIILDMALMKEITVSLPTPSAVTLHDSFAQLHLSSSRLSPNEPTAPQQPVYLYKRNADTASVTGTAGEGRSDPWGMGEGSKRRREPADVRDSGRPTSQRSRSNLASSSGGSGSGSGSGGSREGSNGGGMTGDIELDGDQNMSSSSASASENTSRTGSGSSNRHSGTTGSTAPTSVTDAKASPRDIPRPTITTRDSSAYSLPTAPPSGSASASFDRSTPTTYVNPSPTTSTSGTFPFASSTPSFTSASFASSPSVSLGSGGFGYSPHQLQLNTNPAPPPYTIVTFGAGTDSKLLDSTTARSPYGAFYVPTSAFPVGAGQFLLGGFGFIGRKHGLAMDNLVEAEVVLADGRVVWVGDGENGHHAGEWLEGEDPEELWWGLRGAGPALGVVTRFRAKAYYLPSVFAGNFIYIFDRNTAPSLLRHVRDCVKGAPRTLYANVIMTAGPPGAPAIVVIQLCFSGPRSEGEMYVQAISSWDGGRCLFQDFSERSFERQQVAVEDVLKGGFGKKWYIKSDMISCMPDDLIDETCNRFNSIPDGCTWLFEFTGGGAPGDVSNSCYPKEHRQAMFTVAALHQWAHDEPPALDTRCVTTAEQWIKEVIKPHSTGGPLPCFLQSSTKTDVMPVYGSSYPRLLALKEKFDPLGFFCHSMFPRPNAPDEWDQLPPITQAKIRQQQADKRALAGHVADDSSAEVEVAASGVKGKNKSLGTGLESDMESQRAGE